MTTHVLKCATEHVLYEGLEGEVKRFWDLESLGIKTPSIHEEFLEKLTHRGDHYQVNLPWKATHPPLPDNYELSQRRLSSLLSRLRKEPDVLKEYDSVIRDQIDRGIVEVVDREARPESNRIHYIPHHAVIRWDKSTTRLRFVYDASAKSDGASLNECLHAGPPLAQNIFDIMWRFRGHRIALVGDIEKAFLMVHKQQWNLFEDERGVVRCQGRFGNSDLVDFAKYPILLDSNHYFSILVVWSCHRRVMHGGVKETLAELRSTFWIVRGRFFVRRLLFGCTACKKFQGKPCKTPPPPPLPGCRVKEAPAFTYIGLDYLGPLYVRSTSEKDRKVWICLFACCVTRAVHFEVVPNLTAAAFLRCFMRYVARRSIPSFVISDNAKTFKSASKELEKIMNDLA